MSKCWTMVAGALLLLCLTAPLAWAAGETQVTLRLGSAVPTGNYKDLASSGSTAGLSADYKVNKWLASGLYFSYVRNTGSRNGRDITVTEPTTGNPVVLTLAENWTVTGLGLFSKVYVLPRGKLAPYLRAGAGVYTVRYGLDVSAASATTTAGGTEQQSKFGLHGGAGVAYRVAGGFRLGVDALYHTVFMKDKDTNVSLFSIGVTLGLGSSGEAK